jgi:hypothetical protein
MQVGSLVDSAVSPSGRTSKYVYRNTHPSGTEGTFLKRATLIETTVELSKGDPVLVYYGSNYKNTAMPAITAGDVLETEETSGDLLPVAKRTREGSIKLAI